MSADNSLHRFLTAQETAYTQALQEIKAGRKRSHWMWYIFPQLQGLGFSETSKLYAIQGRQEAEAYLKHPVLGSRLVSICQELLKLESGDANRIFGAPDDLKLKSSMTLFSSLDSNPVFQAVLEKFFRGSPDDKTLALLGKHH
ncbi:DUF1810 domain-containing protein [Hymenobacter elongatus]|uniref:DUF1810 domain-containing protein n=1 Tax=Hymenobacter elongatus TaxID=877208 RepID=A0A4Z0PKX2_9BACT|nr:DUF1810 domain-containing protein [Hymenobacter elongatus]TGE15787.1 DUF1810 domain-containing protein [Hymenobacter elongatus]